MSSRLMIPALSLFIRKISGSVGLEMQALQLQRGIIYVLWTQMIL